jgi:hypothetical protein
MNAFEVVTGAAHECIVKAAEVGAVLHFLGENIRDVAFSADVSDRDCVVGNPFLCGVLAILDVAVAFCHHVVAPLDAGIIDIVERSRRLGVMDGVAKVRETGDHTSGVDSEMQSHVGDLNFGFALAEGGTFLAVNLPGYNGTAHAAEFEERELDAFPDGISKM